ncbi:MAG: hypothetical protein WBB39_01940 [Candidatus Saccharimonadales bacterium]
MLTMTERSGVLPNRFDVLPLKTTTKLIVDVDEAVDGAVRELERPARVLELLVKQKVFVVESDTAAAMKRYVLRTRTMNNFRDGPKTVVEAYNYLYGLEGKTDPRLPDMRMSSRPISSDGRYGMSVTLRWPEVDEGIAADFATQQMRLFARSLRFHGEMTPKTLNDLVYAVAQREVGILFQTNDMGSCNIESDQGDYTSEPTIELWQHNLYNHEQQLVCLVGAVAFANADSHISNN